MEQQPLILDPCCGSRMMWFDRGHKDVVFGDRRSETLTVTDRSHKEDGQRTLVVEPDALMDFRALPYPDETFYLVAFDPPHLVRAGPRSWLAAKYGKLGKDWREDLRQGFAECFRVLRPHGTLIFKWDETQVKVREVLECAPHPPLFGNTAGKKNGTHWVAFMKPNDRVEGPPLAAVPSHDGLCGNGSEAGAGDTAAGSAPARDIHAELTLAAFHREVAK